MSKSSGCHNDLGSIDRDKLVENVPPASADDRLTATEEASTAQYCDFAVRSEFSAVKARLFSHSNRPDAISSKK